MTGARRWIAWLTVAESAAPLAWFRVGMGVGVLLSALSAAWAGVVADLWLPPAAGGVSPLDGRTWLVALLGPTPTSLWAAWGGLVAAGCALVVGFGGRVAAFVALQLAMGVLDANAAAGGSYDELLFNGLWLLVLTGGTQTGSVDARWATGRWWPPAEVGRWARFLVFYQLILLYAATGWQKLSSHWVPGQGSTALYYILQQPTWQRVDGARFAHPPWYALTQLGTVVTWLWEVSAPLWLWAWVRSLDPNRRGAAVVNAGYAGLGVIVHLAIAALMNVGPFSWISLSFYAAVRHPHREDATPGPTYGGPNITTSPGTSAHARCSPQNR